MLGRQDDHRVVQDGRAAADLLVGGQPGTVADVDAPTTGAMSSTLTCCCSAADRSPSSVAGSIPSVTSTPIFRPPKPSGPFLRMLSAGEADRSRTGSRAAGRAAGSSARPRPSATARARSSSTLRSPATILVRIATWSHC
jgi:hypothetical protein